MPHQIIEESRWSASPIPAISPLHARSKVPASSGVEGIAVAGHHAFVIGTPQDGLVSVSIANPSNISIASTINADPLLGSNAVAIAGDYAYATALYDNALIVVSIVDPSNLTVAGCLEDAASLVGIAVAGG